MILSPAEFVITAFGGVRPLARVLSISPSAVCMWRTDKRRSGSVPTKHYKTIMDAAKKMKLDVTSDDLVFGRKIKQHKKGKKNE